MTTKKQKAAIAKKTVAAKAKAKKLRLLKLEQVEEGKHQVLIEVEGHQDLPPVFEAPVELELEVPDVHQNPFLKWLKEAWGG